MRHSADDHPDRKRNGHVVDYETVNGIDVDRAADPAPRGRPDVDEAHFDGRRVFGRGMTDLSE